MCSNLMQNDEVQVLKQTQYGSMGLVNLYTYIYHKNQPNVGKMHGSCGKSQTEVCPISMDQVAMLALQLNVPKVALGWSCFTMESDKYCVQPNPPKYTSTQVKNRVLAMGGTMFHFHGGVVLERLCL